MKESSVGQRLKRIVVGKAKSPLEQGVFHKISLIAFFAWVGLGADGLSSSCYGPQEAFMALGNHVYLSIFLALAIGITIFLISASYSQIIELFPSGGGGYLVASKLLSTNAGMVSGCALLIDYVLTITISIASGADALFSFLPLHYQPFKLGFAVCGVLFLILLNMRGTKESVIPLVPIFIVFLLTHVFAIVYGIVIHAKNLPQVAQATVADFHQSTTEIGLFGVLFLLMRAYSMGAGTYTGIEAVSNGLPMLRQPRIETGKKTMQYMSFSLSFMVVGLIGAYLLFQVRPQEGRTLNAILFETISTNWHPLLANPFIVVTLISEAMLLFVGAQAGFIGGPAVLANMAVDRWFPTKFATLSDRLVTQNGVLLMGGSALLTMILTKGSVRFLVVLYSINVFITFCFSQLGMVRYWWQERSSNKSWWKKIFINGVGLTLTVFILVSMIMLKFNEGGWITLMVTGALIALALTVKRHYLNTAKLLHRLNDLVQTAVLPDKDSGQKPIQPVPYNPNAKTAVLLVNGFNGLGLHTLFNIIRFFGKEFRNFIFIQVGVVDAGNFKGVQEVGHLQDKIQGDVSKYVLYMQEQGFFAEGFSVMGIDVIAEIEKIAPVIRKKYQGAIFFGGQLVFPRESLFNRWLHNYTVFAMQRRFYNEGIPFVILPIRVY